jgi:hypothetical protein
MSLLAPADFKSDGLLFAGIAICFAVAVVAGYAMKQAGGSNRLQALAMAVPVAAVWFGANAVGDIVMLARGQTVVARVATVETSTDRGGTLDYTYDLARLDGTPIHGYLHSYSGPVLKAGQSVTAVVDPDGYAAPRPPGTMNPTWSLIVSVLSVGLFAGALVFGARSGKPHRRAQGHDAPGAILRET